MELLKRKIYYKGMKGLLNPVITATTLNIPIFLSQDLFNTGIYTDTKNLLPDVVTGFTANWDLSYDGNSQKDCRTTNKCLTTETITNATYYNASDGSISVNVTNQNTLDCPGPLTLSWSGPNGFTNSNLNLVNLQAGNYTLKITDGECNKTFKNYYIPQPPALDSDILINNSQVNDINGTCNGSATVTATGGRPPYTYAWYSAGTTTPVLGTNSTLNNLCVGNYYVIVTDTDGTQVTEFFNISQPPPLSGTVKSVINIDCSGNSGEIKVQGIGGYITNGYTYTLNGITNNTGIFDSGITTPGTYNVIINDNGISTFTLSVTITQPVTPISISITGTKPTTDGFTDSNGAEYLPNGNITFTITGGQGPYEVILESYVYQIDYNASTVCLLNACSPSNISGNGGGSIYEGGYQQSTSGIGTFSNLPSGGYILTVNSADGSCQKTKDFYLEHMYELGNVCVRQYNSTQLVAFTNTTTPWTVVQWDNNTPYTCGVTPCGVTCFYSGVGSSGDELTIEIYANVGGIISYKRIYQIP